MSEGTEIIVIHKISILHCTEVNGMPSCTHTSTAYTSYGRLSQHQLHPAVMSHDMPYV